MLLYVILIAVGNMCLGFAAAVHLRRRAWTTLADGTHRSQSRPSADSAPAAGAANASPVSPATATVEPPTSSSPPAGEHDPGPAQDLEFDAPTEEPDEVELAPPRDKSATERILGHVRGGLARFRAKISDLDSRVRNCVKTRDSREIAGCIEQLRSTNEAYLKDTEQVTSGLLDDESTSKALASVQQRLQESLAQQLGKIEQSQRRSRSIDAEKDPDGSCQKLLDETSELTTASDDLQDQLNQSQVELAQAEGWFDEMEPALLQDQATQTGNLAAFELKLKQIRESDEPPDHVVTMIDIDHVPRITRDHGAQAADGILRSVAELIGETSPNVDVARYRGQKFVLLVPEATPREAVATVERVRQTIEQSTFATAGEQIVVTVSCAVTELRDEEESDALFTRLESTLQEARRYGRNRTFLHEGKYPAPVVPPQITVQPREYDV